MNHSNGEETSDEQRAESVERENLEAAEFRAADSFPPGPPAVEMRHPLLEGVGFGLWTMLGIGSGAAMVMIGVLATYDALRRLARFWYRG